VAVHSQPYTIYGYKGKQVRDQIHSIDVIRAFVAFARNPRPGEPYNLGGGRENSASVLESIGLIEELTERKIQWRYVEQNRRGDHICYISDLRKLKAHYPEWSISRSLRDILQEMVDTERARL
jgi:CDP-paratose 2-epimerase